LFISRESISNGFHPYVLPGKLSNTHAGVCLWVSLIIACLCTHCRIHGSRTTYRVSAKLSATLLRTAFQRGLPQQRHLWVSRPMSNWAIYILWAPPSAIGPGTSGGFLSKTARSVLFNLSDACVSFAITILACSTSVGFLGGTVCRSHINFSWFAQQFRLLRSLSFV